MVVNVHLDREHRNTLPCTAPTSPLHRIIHGNYFATDFTPHFTLLWWSSTIVKDFLITLDLFCYRNNPTAVEVLLRFGFDINKKTSKALDLYLESFDYVSKFRVGSTAIYIATVAGGWKRNVWFSARCPLDDLKRLIQIKQNQQCNLQERNTHQ